MLNSHKMANQMMSAFWGMTINNYDETDLALVQQGYPDFIRQIVYTLEEGKEGTPHIQAYLKLFRQQRLSYVKKLFPRGSFTCLVADDYKLNAQRYAQKLDSTSRSPAVITNNPFPDPIVELMDVMRAGLSHFHVSSNPEEWKSTKQHDLFWYMEREEFFRVSEKPGLAKFYISPTYNKVKKQFWKALLHNIVDTHTHTHTDELFSHSEDHNHGASEDGSDECSGDSGSDDSGFYQGDDDSEGEAEDGAESEGGDTTASASSD